MKTKLLVLLRTGVLVAIAAAPPSLAAQQTSAPPTQPASQAASPGAASPAATPAPPPAAPAKLSMADLEKLVAPIALYPDPLLATVLPASVYPLEIVQAARFVADTNNLAKLDAQPWDENVKAVARVPEAIKKLNEDISWTIELGDAFLAQDKEIMDAIQAMRSKAQKAGTLQTTAQQIVVVTNTVNEKTVEQQVVFVTNTVVQIQPSSSSVVYVPTYNPYTVYYPPPAYYANPYPLLTFGAGMAMGAIIANNCNWYGGGCYHGNVNINVNNNFNQNNNFNRNNNANRNNPGGQQKWQPDQSRLNRSGSPSASTRSSEARGYGSGGARPSTGTTGARPSTGTASARPSAGTAGARPSAGTQSANRPTASAGASRPAPSTSATRPSSSPSASPSRSSSSGSAFGGVSSGSSARDSSSRGSASRSSGARGGGGGGGRGGGGGGGGGRR